MYEKVNAPLAGNVAIVIPVVRFANVSGPAGQTAPAPVTVQVTAPAGGHVKPALAISDKTTPSAAAGPAFDRLMT